MKQFSPNIHRSNDSKGDSLSLKAVIEIRLSQSRIPLKDAVTFPPMLCAWDCSGSPARLLSCPKAAHFAPNLRRTSTAIPNKPT